MAKETIEPMIGRHLLTMRIILLALMTGVVAFAIFALAAPASHMETSFSHMDWIFAGLGIVTAAGGWVIPRLIVASGAAPATMKGDPEKHDVVLALGRIQSALIAGLAMFEGGAFANLVWYYSEKQPLNLLMASLLVLFMIVHFPRRGAIKNAIEAKLRQWREQRQFPALR